MSKTKFVRDKQTGKLLVYREGKLIGEIETIGDEVTEKPIAKDGEAK